MVCNPSDNNLNPPFSGPPPTVPGFGVPFTVPRIPLDIQIPEGVPEDILNLVNSLLARLPGGILKPNPTNEMKDAWDAIADLLSQMAPFLALYSFFQALLNMVLCILDVLCALMSPWKARRAIRRLFKRCIPDFISLFPWIALVAMILSLLLLLLALIEYIINQILAYINDIIRNLQILTDAVQLDDSESVVAAALKIAYLLCLIEQIFAILGAFAAILQIIQALISVRGRSVCGRGPSRQGDDNDCCTEDVCPDFISNNEDGLFGERGTLKYMRARYDLTISSVLIREESHQFFDENTQLYPFSDIITPVDGSTFWPDNVTFDSLSSYRRIPYFLDMEFGVDPSSFGHSDTDGYRIFQIKDVIVERRPYLGVYQYNNSLAGTQNGTLRLTGGLVYEADGITPYSPSGTQLTLDTFITQSSTLGAASSDDSVEIIDVSYNLRINHDALVGYQLINIMCVPDVAVESLVFNTSTVGTFGIESTEEKLINAGGSLPNVEDAVSCLQSALVNFRQDVSITNAASFQASVTNCMNDLKTQTEDAFVGAVVSGTSIYESTIEIDPSIQFIKNPIRVVVQLKDANGIIVSSGLPSNLQSSIENKIKGYVTFGEVSGFTYDSDANGFIATIYSETPNTGILTVSFDDQFLGTILNREDLDAITSLETLTVPYSFVGSVAGEDVSAKQRRDEGDVADIA